MSLEKKTHKLEQNSLQTLEKFFSGLKITCSTKYTYTYPGRLLTCREYSYKGIRITFIVSERGLVHESPCSFYFEKDGELMGSQYLCQTMEEATQSMGEKLGEIVEEKAEPVKSVTKIPPDAILKANMEKVVKRAKRRDIHVKQFLTSLLKSNTTES